MKTGKYLKLFAFAFIILEVVACGSDDNNKSDARVSGFWWGDSAVSVVSVVYTLFLNNKSVSVLDLCQSSNCAFLQYEVYIFGDLSTYKNRVTVKNIEQYDAGVSKGDVHLHYFTDIYLTVNQLKGKMERAGEYEKMKLDIEGSGLLMDYYLPDNNFFSFIRKRDIEIKPLPTGTLIYKEYVKTTDSYKEIYVNTITIQDDGSIWGQDSNSCVMSGNVDWESGKNNVYEITWKIESCGELNGNYAGLATTEAPYERPYEGLDAIVYNEKRAIHYRFNTPEHWAEMESLLMNN